MFDHICLAADHHAVASFESPDATAGANINVMDLFRRQFLCATDVVNVIRIPAVDQDVSRFEERQKIFNRSRPRLPREPSTRSPAACGASLQNPPAKWPPPSSL